MEVRAQNQIGFRRSGRPAAVDHMARPAARTVIQTIGPGRDFHRAELNVKALLPQHGRDDLAILLGLRIEADRGDVFEPRKAPCAREPGIGQEFLRQVRIVFRIGRRIDISELHRRDPGV